MSVLYKFFKLLVDFFPEDPFLALLTDFKALPALGYLNYFVPVSFMVNATSIWVGAVVTYRVIKMVVDFVIKLFK